MYEGKLVFAQVMEHLPLHSFRRIVARYSGEHKARVVLVPGSVLVHGVRTADLSGEPSGHRGVPARAALEALSPGDSVDGGAQHAGQCQRGSALADLRRRRPEPNRHRETALCRRTLRGRLEGVGLRPGHHDHRSVLVSVSLGAVPLDQGSGQAAHAARLARQYPDLLD